MKKSRYCAAGAMPLYATLALVLWGGQRCHALDAEAGAAELSVASIKILVKEKGGRVDWCHRLNLIAFDRKGADGYYGVYTMKPDGSDVKSLSENCPDLPKRHVGQPAWHPSGKYLVLQAEKAEHKEGPFSALAAHPGAGAFNDLWVLNIETNKGTRVVELPDGNGKGVLHPHFSADGKMLSWAEMYAGANLFKKGQEFGLWKEKVANFSVGPSGPVLTNVKEFQPLGEGWYENHGFSPDGTKLIFTCNAALQGQPTNKRTDICVLDLKKGSTITLTTEKYNEHAIFSPDGQSIVWMSGGDVNGSTDYWIMNADGSGKQRLTYFSEPGHAHYQGYKTVVAADFSWSPDGRKFAAYYHTGLSIPGAERILLIELEKAKPRDFKTR